jgi:hypothetical protein
VPVLDTPAGLGSTRYVTVPAPEPEAPVRTTIQDALGTADHAHPPGTFTATLLLPPAAPMFCVVGLSDVLQAAPAWETTNGSPATVIVAERELLFGFAATRYPTLPLPVPEGVVLKVIQLTGLCAVHGQAAPAVTATVPDAAEAEIEALAGEML